MASTFTAFSLFFHNQEETYGLVSVYEHLEKSVIFSVIREIWHENIVIALGFMHRIKNMGQMWIPARDKGTEQDKLGPVNEMASKETVHRHMTTPVWTEQGSEA